MKTTSEQLLARAEELEARARALRIAATEMNGHQTAEKQAKVGELFKAAGKLRKAVKIWEEPEPQPGVAALAQLVTKRGKPRRRFTAAELGPVILPLLDGATRTTIELRQLLANQGLAYGVNHLRNILDQLPQAKRVGGGRGTDVRWQLRSGPQGKPGKQGKQPLARRPRTTRKWTAAQHQKFRASMKRVNAEKRAAAAAS